MTTNLGFPRSHDRGRIEARHSRIFAATEFGLSTVT